MLQKVRIADPGNTTFLEGEHVGPASVQERTTGWSARASSRRPSSPVLGITKHRSRRSFHLRGLVPGDHRVLTEAAIQARWNYLRGLKENVIIGN